MNYLLGDDLLFAKGAFVRSGIRVIIISIYFEPLFVRGNYAYDLVWPME